MKHAFVSIGDYKYLKQTASLPDYNPYQRKPNIPRIEEVKEFFFHNKMNERDAVEFFLYYDSLGWFIGNTPIVNWRSKALQWKSLDSYKQNQNQNNNQPENNKTISDEERKRLWNKRDW